MSDKVKKEITPTCFRYVLPYAYTEAEKEANPIAAEEIVEAIKDGKAVEIINAVIDGPFVLKSVTVKGEVYIKQTTIKDYVDWSYADFKQLMSLENSIFESDAIFTAAKVQKDIFLDNATFRGKTTLSDLTVTGIFYSRSTIFEREAIFDRATFTKSIFPWVGSIL